MKTKKVYLLSVTHGTWQVGNVVYCLPTATYYDVDTRKPKKYFLEFEVDKRFQGWEAVEEANKQYQKTFNDF